MDDSAEDPASPVGSPAQLASPVGSPAELASPVGSPADLASPVGIVEDGTDCITDCEDDGLGEHRDSPVDNPIAPESSAAKIYLIDAPAEVDMKEKVLNSFEEGKTGVEEATANDETEHPKSNGKDRARLSEDTAPGGEFLGYLPMEVRGKRILLKEAEGRWRISNRGLRSKAPGVLYRKTKDLNNLSEKGETWGSVVSGVEEHGGWVRCVKESIEDCAMRLALAFTLD